MGEMRYALLDTDFISKTHRIVKSDSENLLDLIISMPRYKFFCHEQIKIELSRHNIAGAPEWLENAEDTNKVMCYTDGMILNELSEYYGDNAPLMYSNMLKTGCDAYSSGYFETNFREISELDYTEVSISEFLGKLDLDCKSIGEGNNLGELKSYVLLQFLSFLYGKQIYVFCSDDKNARNGVTGISGARCISVLSSFMRLIDETGMTQAEATPYIQSWLQFLATVKQTEFKVEEKGKVRRMACVPCGQVLNEIFDGKFEELSNGNLKYK